MTNDDIVRTLKDKYADVHPLMFNRSKEKAKTPGELFTILSTIPDELPIIWSEEERRWVHTKDLFQK